MGPFKVACAVTLGGGNDLAVSTDGRLGLLRQEGSVQVIIILGKATKDAFDSLSRNAMRLRIHAVDAD